ncbi:MAG: GrpB family protein, partial [Acidimicrobiales bacterium]
EWAGGAMSGRSAEQSAGDGLGLDRREVRLSPHNPDWVTLGAQECAAVAALLGQLAVAVVHVGSTAVPGLEAKPILDIAAAVRDQVPIDDVVSRLCEKGSYAYDGDRRDDGGLLFVRGEGTFRTVHVHVVGQGSRAWEDYLRFHALLRDDPDARDAYQTAKRQLARTFARDRPGYTKAKGIVVEELLGSDDHSPPPHPD